MFMITSHRILLRTRNSPDENFIENQNMYFMFYNIFQFFFNVATEFNIIWLMCFAYWIIKATDTNSECVIIFFFQGNNGCKNAPQYHVISKLLVLFLHEMQNNALKNYCVFLHFGFSLFTIQMLYFIPKFCC